MRTTLIAFSCLMFLVSGAGAQESMPAAPAADTAAAPVPAPASPPASKSAAPAPPLPRQEVELGLQLSHIVYKEPDVMRESGYMFGIAASYAGNTSNVRLKFDGTLTFGSVEYVGSYDVLSVLVQSHSYLVARYGFDGFRIDTVKYVHPQMIEYFGNAMREFALSIGKKNFFTFAEVYDDEPAIAAFVGRNASESGSFGVDAALDFPLFYKLPAVAKGMAPVETLRQVFEDHKAAEKELLSTHGEAGR